MMKWINKPTGQKAANGWLGETDDGQTFYVQGPEDSRWWLYKKVSGDWEYIENFRTLTDAKRYVRGKLICAA